jgi:serine phosphatase RsbU (regulator of sigma subunit)
MAVGGDWYDVVELPSGHIGLAIGDVAGHGPRAASTMGQLRMALRAYAPTRWKSRHRRRW